MATWQEFDTAVSNTKANDPVAKKWPDASSGSYGGANAGPVESYGTTGEDQRGISDPKLYDPVVTPAGLAPDGMAGYVRGDISVHEHFGPYDPSCFHTAAAATCYGSANTAKKWSDACGGGLGTNSDGYKD